MVYRGNRSCSALGDAAHANTPEEADIYPDFVTIARDYRVRDERVTRMDQLAAALDRMLEHNDEPYLLDILVEAEANIYPMIPAGASYRDTILNDEQLVAAEARSQDSNI